MMINMPGETTPGGRLPQDQICRPVRVDHSTELSDSIIRIPIDMLRNAESPRLAGIDQGHVRTLAACADKLPPIIVHRSTMKVIDGMHRLHVARLNDQETVEVRYFEGSEREAFLLAVELNMKHGLALTLSDRKKSAMKILEGFPEWSDRAIAVKTGLSGKTVGALRRKFAGQIAQAPLRVGRDGRVRPLNSHKGRRKTIGIPPEESDVLLRETTKPASMSVPTARDTQKRLVRDDSPLQGAKAHTRAPQAGLYPMGSLVDPVAQLESLKRDPALKYSNDGREMIRWLEARIIRRTDPGLVLQAPAHQARKIAALARACAAQWNCIAMRMELVCDECSQASN
ncbi:ParB/RepB/Spo0J family partition protein [Streptomyces sp. KMM 9044]|uniref:ParB/RepB/Spo0J family partition protein n=1 Tax=Streptomyces sp. KMM 9044 TaxID=2744474 RepID=UPI002151E7A1|nr:ParB/RepB/Spo0J family partition protein [Streptomyces sp. KMM 9044]WAX76340.1 ParB/RepB/Spo0J family partition protein [Streptomyces sp. KMM 9044]